MSTEQPPRRDEDALTDAELSHLEREIDRFLDLWKHVDSRVPTTWTVLLAVSGAGVSFAALYGRAGSRNGVAALVAGLVCACSFVAGFRIVGTDLTKAEYLVAVNMLRSRIVATMPSLRSRMFIPRLDADESTDLAAVLREHLSQRLPTVPRLSLFSLTGVTGGYAACSIVLALLRSGPRLPTASVVGAVAAVAVGTAQAASVRAYADRRVAWAVGRFRGDRIA